MEKTQFKVGDLVAKPSNSYYYNEPAHVYKITRETATRFFCRVNDHSEVSFRKSDNKWVGEYNERARPATAEDLAARKLFTIKHSNAELYKQNAQFLNIEEAELIKSTLEKAKKRHDDRNPRISNP